MGARFQRVMDTERKALGAQKKEGVKIPNEMKRMTASKTPEQRQVERFRNLNEKVDDLVVEVGILTRVLGKINTSEPKRRIQKIDTTEIAKDVAMYIHALKHERKLGLARERMRRYLKKKARKEKKRRRG